MPGQFLLFGRFPRLESIECSLRGTWRSALLAAVVVALSLPLRADGPADNNPETVRRIPKLGIEVSAEDRAKLQAGLDELKSAIDKLASGKDAKTLALLPDIRIYWEAVNTALTYQEFFDAKEIPVALELLAEGKERAGQLAEGEAPWARATGLVVRGYVSKIDGSVQPYGLVVPERFNPKHKYEHRLDLWFHGRGETLSEVNFLQNRRKTVGQFAPPDTFVLHPYGRYCNANKFAGEVDVFEALDDVRKRYPIDEDRITVRGFSMGGASTWQLAVHYPTLWAAANPGAGFSETPQFLKSFQKQELNPTWWEEKLWQWYDCDKWAENLWQCTTVAYSGEKDIQKQAADVMAKALQSQGLQLIHIIGPGAGHSYHPESAREVERRMEDAVSSGPAKFPHPVRFNTCTLKYNQCAWITIDGVEEEWTPSRVVAEARSGKLKLKVSNVTALALNFRSEDVSPDWNPEIQIETNYIDRFPTEETISPKAFVRSDRSVSLSLHVNADSNHWVEGPLPVSKSGLRKIHGLQGPVDDAFMDAFVFVRPTGKAKYEKADAWARSELDRAIEHWRRHFRGQARVKNDSDITDADIASMNLVLWGDPSSNAVFAKIADKLPIRYDGDRLVVRSSVDEKGNDVKDARSFDAAHHAPILIYPNPLNPKKYVVLNSSFTFREFAYLNNARQVPMLPDWAIVDLRTSPGIVWPGKIADADFFDEEWQVKRPHK